MLGVKEGSVLHAPVPGPFSVLGSQVEGVTEAELKLVQHSLLPHLAEEQGCS